MHVHMYLHIVHIHRVLCNTNRAAYSDEVQDTYTIIFKGDIFLFRLLLYENVKLTAQTFVHVRTHVPDVCEKLDM